MPVCEKLGVKIYENTAVVNVDKVEKVKLKTEYDNIIEANNVVIASHFPWYDGMNFYFAKNKGDKSYLIATEYNREFQEGMFINIEEPTKTFTHYKGEGKDLLIGFNPKFLIDALRVIDDEEVTLYLMNPKAPCFIKDEKETYIYLILPVNFNAGV